MEFESGAPFFKGSVFKRMRGGKDDDFQRGRREYIEGSETAK
jgi:hypothetical protein